MFNWVKNREILRNCILNKNFRVNIKIIDSCSKSQKRSIIDKGQLKSNLRFLEYYMVKEV